MYQCIDDSQHSLSIIFFFYYFLRLGVSIFYSWKEHVPYQADKIFLWAKCHEIVKKKKKFCKFNCHSTGCGRNTSYIRQVVEDTITTILLLCGRYCCCTLYKRLKRLSYNYYLTVHNTYSLVPNNCQNQVSFCTNIFFFKFPC